jgi:hypothetical protein
VGSSINLTDDDIELLKAVPMMAGAIVATLGTTGIIEAGREMLASARVVAEGVHRFPDDPLVALLHTALHDTGNDGTNLDTSARPKTNDPMVAMAAFVEQLDRALDVLDAKVRPADADGYKRWIMACAEASAEAAKEGGVFGIGGKRVSEGEAAYMAHLRNRLGLPPGEVP